MSTPPVFCTVRDIEELGIGPNALKTLADKHKRSALRARSSMVATALRRRHLLPLTASLVEFEATLATGASASAVGTPEAVADVVVEVVTGGPAGGGASVKVSLDDGETFGSPVVLDAPALGPGGVLLVAGVTVTFTGTLVTGNKVTWRAEVEGCVRAATALLSAHVLLHNRGLAPATMETLKQLRDEAVAELDAWAEGVTRELPPDADASPDIDEGGPMGDGQENPWDWQDEL